MPTLLIRLTAPTQAWGVHTPYETHNPTLQRPTKSGVIGLLCNALGHDRDTPTGPLADLRFAVRADRPGHLETDDQTAGGGTFPLDILTARDPHLAKNPDAFLYGAPREITPGKGPSWDKNKRFTVKGDKTYLVDASFLAGLTGEEPLLTILDQALRSPRRLLYLGRRCCPPAQPLAYGITPHDTDWPHHTPLLPDHTTTRPTAWTETHTPTDPALPEQPPTHYALRDHRNLPMHQRTTTPPPAPAEEPTS